MKRFKKWVKMLKYRWDQPLVNLNLDWFSHSSILSIFLYLWALRTVGETEQRASNRHVHHAWLNLLDLEDQNCSERLICTSDISVTPALTFLCLSAFFLLHLSWYWLCDRWAGTDRLTLPGLVLNRDSDGADAWLRSRCLGRGLRRALVPANGKGGRGNFIYFSVGWFPAGWHRDKQDHHRQYYS